MTTALTPERAGPTTPDKRRPALAVFTFLFAAAALTTPLWAAEPDRAAGLLLLGGVGTELVQSFRHKSAASRHTGRVSAAYSLLLALILLNAAWLAASALAIFAAVPFALDALRSGGAALRLAVAGPSFRSALSSTVRNSAAVAGVLLVGRYAPHLMVGICAGVRLFTAALNITTAPSYLEGEAEDSAVDDIGLDDPELDEIASRLNESETARVSADRGWIAVVLAVLMAIHVSRMGFDKSALGILSPLVAVIGDVVVALALAYLVLVPSRLFIRRITKPLERRAWQRVLHDEPQPTRWMRYSNAALRWRLESRLRFAVRLRSARFSLPSAFARGLQIGLPLATIIVASVPIWGMSWYFDTENWAAGIWNSWVSSRTDIWRAAMIKAVIASGESGQDGLGFAVAPDGFVGDQPFSFIVIGDTGEGDASQHVLRDSLLRAAALPDVQFTVLSSDVVYPTGAMKDYESRFWLPFKGVTKPVYAIPGNHDWYDALEGFAATFFTSAAARAAMRARIEADGGLSSTTDERIEEYIAKARFFREQYGVPTGGQRAPFFEVQTPRFALLAVDTGVMRRVDDEQLAWLRGALDRARGKIVMAVLGHPFFAGGHDVSVGDKEFTALRELLRAYGVRAVMAGDTHDLEYYREAAPGGSGEGVVHHWVNGGGGAYLSFGTSLAWPEAPATVEWAHYPSRNDVVAKISSSIPWWKWPVWLWTRDLGAWPWTAEWLSAMFDSNVAPFFQSFVVVSVDPAGPRVTVRPWGIRDPLKWKDLTHSGGILPAGASPESEVEWVIVQ